MNCKKLLMRGMVASALCVALTGCHSKDVYEPDRPEEDAWELYKRNFQAYVGNTIHSDVDWGFGSTTRAMTRATGATVSPTTDYPLLYDNDYYKNLKTYFPEGSEKPKGEVTSWEFRQNGAFANLMLVWSNTTAHDEVGLYYYDPAKETAEQATKVTLISDVQNGLGNYFQIQQTKNGSWTEPSPTSGYGPWNNGAVQSRCNSFFIQMDASYRFGVYVKNNTINKTYYTNMSLNDNLGTVPFSGALINKETQGEVYHPYAFGMSDDGVPGCELIFVLLKTGEAFPQVVAYDEPAPVLKWHRIIAEDLNAHDLDKDGNSNDTDFDFNDLVLDVALTDGGAKCILRAAGATLKIRINGDDNLEVHKLFGVSQDVMVNTHAGSKGLKGQDGLSPVEFEIKGSFKSADDIVLEVYRQNRWMKLKETKAEATSKIVVGTDFVWPDERESLKTKYPKFLEYVQYNRNPDSWWK